MVATISCIVDAPSLIRGVVQSTNTKKNLTLTACSTEVVYAFLAWGPGWAGQVCTWRHIGCGLILTWSKHCQGRIEPRPWHCKLGAGEGQVCTWRHIGVVLSCCCYPGFARTGSNRRKQKKKNRRVSLTESSWVALPVNHSWKSCWVGAIYNYDGI